MSFDVHELDMFLLIGTGVTLLAILAVRVSSRVGLPSLLLYLLIGVLLGDDVLGIHFDDANVTHALGFAALAVILAEGGLTTDWHEVRGTMKLGAALASVGMGVSVTVVALGCHFLLGMSWELAFLLGAATSATDAAAVFSVLRVVPLPRRITGALESESGLNDAPTVVLVTLISTGAAAKYGIHGMIGIIVYELAVGVAIGLAVGFGGAWLLRRVALPASGLYPITVMCLALFAYGLGPLVHASGFAAVYVAALVLGNSELPHRVASRSFSEGLAWLAQIGLFVMLGLLFSPDRLTWDTLGMALVAGLVLTFVARPLSVLASSMVQPMPWRESAFLSWAGLRGAVPIVFSAIPLANGVAGATKLFDIVFMLVVVYTLVTAPSLPLAAKWLGVARRSQPRTFELEVAPLEKVAADLLQVSISPASRLHGVEVGELRLPLGASVSLIVRGGEILVPERRTVLKHGDDLLVVAPRKVREATERRLRRVSAGGRLAQWLKSDESAS